MSDEHPNFKFKKLIGYSQGLLGFHYNDYRFRDHEFVVIWNPSIRKSLVIPFPECRHYRTDFVFTVFNATDPTIFKITYIYYDDRVWYEDAYVVGSQVDIFTFSTGAWRSLSNASCLPRESLKLTRKAVVIDRFIHWIAYDRTPEGDNLDSLILSFDITSEQFTELCLPPTLAPHTSRTNLNLSKLRESLVMPEYDPYKEIGVWMMMEAGVQNSFTKLFTVKEPRSRVLGFRKNGQPIIYGPHSASYGKTLLVYDPDLEHYKDIGISGERVIPCRFIHGNATLA